MIDTPPPVVPSASPSLRHSALGVAAFVVSLIVGFSLLALLLLAAVLVQRGSPGNYPGQQLVGFAVLFLAALDCVALGLGIAGLCQPRCKKVFAVLGTVFSGLTIVGTIGLILIGLYANAHVAG